MPEDGRLYITRTKAILTREQKTGLGMVIGFGALALVFGSFYVWKHMASPFTLSYTGPKFLTGNEQRQQEMEKLQKEDTDSDGLNDYEELYIYGTSPYIADSDSDGTNDDAEIKAGDDPNCAPGMPCDAVDVVNPATLKGTFAEDTATSAVNSMTTGTSDGAVSGSYVGSAEILTPENVAAALSGMSPDDIRTMLLESGGDPEVVNALSDDELMAALLEIVQSLETEGTTGTGTSSSSEVNGN